MEDSPKIGKNVDVLLMLGLSKATTTMANNVCYMLHVEGGWSYLETLNIQVEGEKMKWRLEWTWMMEVEEESMMVC